MESWWFEAEGFKESWEESWKGSQQETWQTRLNKVNENIKVWAKERRSPQNRLQEAQNCLYQNQLLHPTIQNQNIEEACLCEIEKAEREIEQYWK